MTCQDWLFVVGGALVVIFAVEALILAFNRTAHQMELGKVEERLEEAHRLDTSDASWLHHATQSERLANSPAYKRADPAQWRTDQEVRK